MITTLKISKLRLSKILMQINGKTLAKIKVEVPVKVLKSFEKDFRNLTQLADVNIMINYDIDANSNVKFTKMSTGNTIPRTPLLLDKGAFYLKSRILNETYQNVFNSDRRLVNPKIVLDKLQKKQKVDFDKNIIIQDIALNDIREIQINNINYIVKY